MQCLPRAFYCISLGVIGFRVLGYILGLNGENERKLETNIRGYIGFRVVQHADWHACVQLVLGL